MKIWIDDAIVESSREFISADGWPVGSGVFETIRTESLRPQLLSRHMRRVLLSAGELSVSLPGEDHILDAIDQLLAAEPHPIGRLRLSFSTSHFVATHELYKDEQNAMKVRTHHSDSQASSRKHKSFPYSDNLQLLSQAKSEGFDEVIVIDSLGRVTEGAVSNFAFRIKGEWITPPITSGILPGVIRALAIEKCDVAVREVTEPELGDCDAAFAMSSLKIAGPVHSLNEKKLSINNDTEQICSKLRELARTL
jgi:branched-chain amino acid aminotransferase